MIRPPGMPLRMLTRYTNIRPGPLEEVNRGAKKPIGGWFIPLGYVFIFLCIAALVLGVKYGSIG